MADYQAIIDEAVRAASNAIMLEKLKWGSEDRINCGSAWIRVIACRHEKAYGFIRFLTTRGIGRVDFRHSAHIISMAGMGGYNGQSMDIKEAGAMAYAKVLNDHGLVADVRSRID